MEERYFIWVMRLKALWVIQLSSSATLDSHMSLFLNPKEKKLPFLLYEKMEREMTTLKVSTQGEKARRPWFRLISEEERATEKAVIYCKVMLKLRTILTENLNHPL